MEKRSRNIDACLRQYLKAMRNLKNQGEFISKKISFVQTPNDLQMEFLEVFYRFHASILKMALQPNNEPSAVSFKISGYFDKNLDTNW